MSLLSSPMGSLGNERGFTMIELVIAMAVGMVVSLAAFAFLKFTTGDVSHITERVHVDQTGSVALERIMLELHSTCVTPSVTPVQLKSNENVIKFISEGGKESAFNTVHLHEIIYTPANGASEGTLIEKSYLSIPPPTGKSAPEYTFPKTATTTTLLLTGVRQSEYEGKSTPIFQYFRYYRKGDTPPKGDTVPPYGELNPTPITAIALEKVEEAEDVAKATVSFTLAPQGKESATFGQDRPVVLEDSAVFRLAPSSESSSSPNQPCSPET